MTAPVRLLRAALSTLFRQASRLMPWPLRHRLLRCLPQPLLYGVSWILMLGIADRVVLERSVLPMLIGRGGKILSVGVDFYNAHHARLCAAGGAELWTIDIDPQRAQWGAPGRHITGSALELEAHFARDSFDAVLVNGVLGHGIDGAPATDRALRSAAAVLRLGGLLVIGWNHDKTTDPTLLRAAKNYFRPVPGPNGAARMAVENATMVYDFLEKTGEPAAG